MKAGQHRFVVEVRRHRTRSGDSAAKPAMSEMALEAQRDEAIKNVEVAAPDSSFADTETVANAGSRHAGRILPSLVESSPWTLTPAEPEPKPSARRRRRAASDVKPAAPKPQVARDSAKPIRRKAQAEAKTAAPAGAGKGAAAVKTQRGAKQTDIGKNARAERKHAIAQSPSAPESPAKSLPAGDESESKARHRRIMGRYVYGTEFKPGERWKQRRRLTR